jgi:hypothetical protein
MVKATQLECEIKSIYKAIGALYTCNFKETSLAVRILKEEIIKRRKQIKHADVAQSGRAPL